MEKSMHERIKEEQEKNPRLEWIEKHDRLYTDEETVGKLKLANQLAFWRKNCDIRKALKETEENLATALEPSVREAGWSEIARKAKCDRNTLKKVERFEWVNAARERLLRLIQMKNEKQQPPLQIVLTEEDKKMQLENQLSKSKEETARWFIKYEAINRELQLVRQALERQTKVNRQLIEQNQKFLKEKNL